MFHYNQTVEEVMKIKSDQSNSPAPVLPIAKSTRGAKKEVPKKSSVSLITLTLVSRQRMLQSALTDEALDALPGGSGKMEQPKLKEMTYQQRADLVRYHGPNDEFGIPQECLFAALVHAGRFVKFDGKRNISNAEMSMVPGFLLIQEEFLAFKDQSPDSWVVDKRRVVNPATGGAMCAIRPCFPHWEADVTVEIDHSGGIKLEQVRQLFETAGRESGLGDHRKKGSFGRFTVTNWKVTEKELDVVEAA
jgi:hypothetical protein